MNTPNLLFIFTDQQAAKTMKVYGNDLIHTPNMDRLASDSIVFKNAYVSQPVCTPSRGTIMTGLYPHSHGCIENNMHLNKDILCLPELCNFEEYNTAYYGKWHLGDEIFTQHGFKDWKSIEDGYREYYSVERDKSTHSSYYEFLVKNGFTPDKKMNDGFKYFSRGYSASFPEEFSKPVFLANEASQFIKENKNNPFILYVNFLEPHTPYHGPRDNQYDLDKISLPENFYSDNERDIPFKIRLFQKRVYNKGASGLPAKTEDDFKRIIANYWGSISLVDSALGKILDTLGESGIDSNTIIVYTSDHGDMMGSHKLLTKCVMYNEAVKVPLLLKIPDINCSKKVVENPVSQVDLIPTLVEAMGKPVPGNLDGFSWIPFLEGKSHLQEENVFIEWNGRDCGYKNIISDSKIPDIWKEDASTDEIITAISDPVRTIITPDMWKYNHSAIGEDELYNLKSDPYEMNSLATDPKYSILVGELKNKIYSWQQRTNDITGL